jgi:hypothetical protein
MAGYFEASRDAISSCGAGVALKAIVEKAMAHSGARQAVFNAEILALRDKKAPTLAQREKMAIRINGRGMLVTSLY